MKYSPHIDLCRLRTTTSRRASSWDRTGGNRDWYDIAPGQSLVLADLRGPGLITHIWMTQMDAYRETLLRITWDNAPHPSVLVPIGDFFGLGHGIVNSYQSHLFSTSTNDNNKFNKGCALNCYIPMPFRERALLEVVYEGSAEGPGRYFHIDYETGQQLMDDDTGYFHAEWRRKNPFGSWAPANLPLDDSGLGQLPNLGEKAWKENYLILETRGRGHYIGCNLSVTNLCGGWWGEGDEMIWVDGFQWPPALHGTGSEDYFGQAWGMQPNAHLRCGSSIHEGETQGYQTCYVHHLENPVRFQKEIRVTIEGGHANSLRNEMSSTAYWYAREPAPACAVPPVQQRLPVLRRSDGTWDHSPERQITEDLRPDGASQRLLEFSREKQRLAPPRYVRSSWRPENC